MVSKCFPSEIAVNIYSRISERSYVFTGREYGYLLGVSVHLSLGTSCPGVAFLGDSLAISRNPCAYVDLIQFSGKWPS
jgi:hypothetical protein